VLVRRWYKLVDRCDKRLWLEFRRSHTLLAGLVFRGTSGHSRAQTVQILLNSMALELVVLCMMYSAEDTSGEPVVINPVTVSAKHTFTAAHALCTDLRTAVRVALSQIVVSGAFAAAICIPGMLLFAACFNPFVSARKFACCLVRLPCNLSNALKLTCRRRGGRALLASHAAAGAGFDDADESTTASAQARSLQPAELVDHHHTALPLPDGCEAHVVTCTKAAGARIYIHLRQASSRVVAIEVPPQALEPTAFPTHCSTTGGASCVVASHDIPPCGGIT
jgi:hypothetical protein